jgi:hypothetical protein
MSTKGILIGIGGVARAGKDTFAKLLVEYAASKGRVVSSFAFADELKRELEPFFKTFGSTAFETDPEKKKKIRPILVAHGREKRLVSNGRYWIEKIEPAVKDALERGDIVLVTDTRYATHDADEAAWVKSLGGKIVYVERLIDNVPVAPANEEESLNDPLLRKAADIIVSWPTVENLQKNIDKLTPFVDTVWSQAIQS